MKMLQEYLKSDSSHHNLDFENRRDPQGILLRTALLSSHRKHSMKYLHTE